MNTTIKATGGAVGAGVGVALAQILVGLMPQIPANLEGAFSVVLTAAMAWIAAYYAPANTPAE